MRLTTVQITNFKSIEDTTPFTVGDVTCLVGKNESGKTAILEALYRLNPYDAEDGTFDKTQEYPRRYLSEYDDRHRDGEADVVTTTWKLDQEDMAAIASALGEGVIIDEEVTITKGYKDGQVWRVTVSDQQAALNMLEKAGLAPADYEAAKKHTTVSALLSHLTSKQDNVSSQEQSLLSEISNKFPNGRTITSVRNILSKRMPKFLYFSNYTRMDGEVSLDEIIRRRDAKQLEPEDQVFLAFLALSGVDVDELRSIDRFEPLIANIESASIRISREIFRYWTQNRHLKVEFRVDPALTGDPPPFNQGRIMRARVENRRHEVTVSFDDRSTGFVWFFSFLVLFSQVNRNYNGKVIILLDEPGLSLHAKAQADLLRYINERLRPDHQVIYSTHSPFMVPAEDLLSVRTVEDVVNEAPGEEPELLGTKVGDDVLSTDKDTLFPLQGALGYELTQSLFVGEHTLLVEGPSDILYLQALSQELRDRKRTYLDPRWTICPVGGVDKVAAFVTLFGGNRLHVAALIDYVQGQKNKVEQLRRNELLRDGHVLTADTFADQSEADTEDIIGRANYIELVSRTYRLKATQRLPKTRPADAPPRVVKETEDRFRTLPPEMPEFNHFAPAEYLLQHRAEVMAALPDLNGTLGRFERLFEELNSFLPSAETGKR